MVVFTDRLTESDYETWKRHVIEADDPDVVVDDRFEYALAEIDTVGQTAGTFHDNEGDEASLNVSNELSNLRSIANLARDSLIADVPDGVWLDFVGVQKRAAVLKLVSCGLPSPFFPGETRGDDDVRARCDGWLKVYSGTSLATRLARGPLSSLPTTGCRDCARISRNRFPNNQK